MEIVIGLREKPLGHKAKITDIKAVVADFLGHKEDSLTVYLSYIGYDFAVSLPVKRYGTEEFLAKVKVEAEYALSEISQAIRFAIADLNDLEKEYLRRMPERQKELDIIADKIKSKIGLAEEVNTVEGGKV